MKVGDIVKFSKWHSSRPGYEYTKEWIGLVYGIKRSRRHMKVQWVTAEGNALLGLIPLGDNRSYEVISESR